MYPPNSSPGGSPYPKVAFHPQHIQNSKMSASAVHPTINNFRRTHASDGRYTQINSAIDKAVNAHRYATQSNASALRIHEFATRMNALHTETRRSLEGAYGSGLDHSDYSGRLTRAYNNSGDTTIPRPSNPSTRDLWNRMMAQSRMWRVSAELHGKVIRNLQTLSRHGPKDVSHITDRRYLPSLEAIDRGRAQMGLPLP